MAIWNNHNPKNYPEFRLPQNTKWPISIYPLLKTHMWTFFSRPSATQTAEPPRPAVFYGSRSSGPTHEWVLKKEDTQSKKRRELCSTDGFFGSRERCRSRGPTSRPTHEWVWKKEDTQLKKRIELCSTDGFLGSREQCRSRGLTSRNYDPKRYSGLIRGCT